MKRFKCFSIPYFVWLIILVVLPLVLMFALTFLQSDGMSLNGATLTMKNYKELTDFAYWEALWNSLVIAFWTTIICLLIGYPVAYFISFSNLKHKVLILLCMILPMWCNSMLRILSWYKLFSSDLLSGLSLIGSKGAVIFVTVTTYLPFMIFPIYTILEKLDRSLIEASKDLGVPAWKTFFKVTLPLSLDGAISGMIMVFLPAATGFAISAIIGDGKVNMIGNIIENMFKTANNYNLGSLLSIFVSVIIIFGLIVLDKTKKEDGILWWKLQISVHLFL